VCGRFVVVFNGEIYNHLELKKELEDAGWTFRGHSDTEVMLAMVSRAGGLEGALESLQGMFAVAVWDRESRRITIARDRLGKKPLYYGRVGARWVAASELKALCRLPGWPGRLDRRALALFLRLGYIPAPHTAYEGISKLAAGTCAVLDSDGEARVRTYWDARQVLGRRPRPARADDNEIVAEFDQLLSDSVRRRMIADVPLGAFLSGGIDSSLVVATMQRQASQPVRTFTIGFHEATHDEAAQARAVAAHLGTNHTELYLTPAQTLEVIPALPDLYDEPFADPSAIPTYLVSKLARQDVTVALSGDGGDELFAGYNRYRWATAIWRRTNWWPTPLRSGVSRVLEGMAPAAVDAIYRGVRSLLPSGLRMSQPAEKIAKLAPLVRQPSADDVYRSLVTQWPASTRPIEAEPGATVLDDASIHADVPQFTERMMLWDLLTYLPDDILCKVDRASMAVGLEARAPLLDQRLVEWVWGLPLDVKLRAGRSKWLLRERLAALVPPALFERPKMGFGVPIGQWLRGPLRGWAEDLLAPAELARGGLVDPQPIRQSWASHLEGRRDEQYRLWTILMLQAWRARWAHS
jgi:asparagine synthase (glutamine-hydrolysing)